MVVLAPARLVSSAGEVLAQVPGEGHPGPGYEPPPVPAGTYARGEEHLVAVADFRTGRNRGVLWGAEISYGRQTRSRGPAGISIDVPLTRQTMRVLGEPTDFVSQSGSPSRRQVPLRWELLAGTTLTGVTDRYVVRGPVRTGGGKISIDGIALDGLPGDRVVGAATRANLLDSRRTSSGLGGSFEHGLAGWRKVGGCEATIVDGGPSGKKFVRLSGRPGVSYLAARARWSQPPRPWGRARVGGSAFVRLPTGDWDRYGLVTVAVFSAGAQVWPPVDAEDTGAGLFDNAMARNRWLDDPIDAFGYLPTPPYDAEIELRLHPVSEDNHVDFDAGRIFLRENTSTVFSVDLTRWVGKLWDHFQHGREQSDWMVAMRYGDPVGVSGIGTWWHDDHITGPEAIEGVCGRDPGPDCWSEGPNRHLKIAKRRGAKRLDIMIRPWDVLAHAGWVIDPGAQRSAVQATSAAGSLWGGTDLGAIDTSQSDGQVITVRMAAPTGLNPNALAAWVRTQLLRLRSLPATATLLVRWELGRRINVGDQIRVVLTEGADQAAVLAGWFRVTGWVANSATRTVTIDVGTDPELGGV